MKAQYICPVLTAFQEDGAVDMEAMKRLFDHLIKGGLDGIAIMGSSGEFYSMTLEQAKQFAKDSMEYLKKRIPVYVGTGRLIPEETIELSNYALELGADAVMIVGPYYIGTSDEGILAYYDRVIGSIRGAVILYNFPDRTGHDLTAEVILDLLAKHKNVIGLKDTFGAPSHTRALIRRIKPQYPAFRIYSGYDDNFAHVVNSGGDGCIAALSNLIPEVCASWVQAFRDEDLQKVAEIQQMIDGMMDFYSLSNPFMPAMKYGLEMVGVSFPTRCQMPVLEVTEQQKAEVEALLKQNLV